MLSIQNVARRIADLLAEPKETLDIEIKGWLDLTNQDHRAVLAKALIALANHGGGFVIIGFEQRENGMHPAGGRPANLAGYTTDMVNAVVTRFAEPPFHCDLELVTEPTSGLQYPIITVPGGHHFPIRSKRSGPNGQTILANAYYVRRPGPQSEPPQSGQEWDALIRRCLANAREELINSFRMILSGGIAAPLAPEAPPDDALVRWCDDSIQRWGALVNGLEPDHPARLQYGYYTAAYRIVGDLGQLTPGQLVDVMRQAVGRHTGWPPFWIPTRDHLRPYIYDDNVECWLGPHLNEPDPGHADFWRASPTGYFFLVRGYQEDGIHNKQTAPGTIFDLTLPTWRIGEILLHAESMARHMDVPQGHVELLIEWTGLAGRQLASFANGNRIVTGTYRARQDSYRAEIDVEADRIGDLLPELVDRIVRPLYELFDFFPLPANLPAQELAKLRQNRF